MKSYLSSASRLALLVVGLALVVIGVALNPGLMSFAFGAGTIGVLGYVNVNDDLIRVLIKQNFLDTAGGYKRNISAKTADYVIVTGTDASGTIFTNRGAGAAVAFTLPAPSAAIAGVYYEFLGIADFAMSVATATADTLIALNDIAADSIAQSTATKLIGSHMRFICDGTSWIGYGDAVGGTFTVAT